MNDDPISIPPFPLKIVTSCLIALLLVAPVVGLIVLGNPGALPIVIMAGFTLIGLTLGLMFLHRIILWIYFRFYWYLMAALYVAVVVFGFYVAVSSAPSPDVSHLDTLPAWAKILLVPGACVGLVAIILAFRHHLPPVVQVFNPPPTQPPPAPQKQILNTAQQIATRKKDLGLDDDEG